VASTPHYDQSFYDEQISGSLGSARVLLAHLHGLWQPASVLDIGCGRGAWLAAWRELGVQDVLGIDGPWNRQELLLDPAIPFRAANLEAPVQPGRRFELAMSIEVVEHLSPAAGEGVVQSLTSCADVVLFSAAFTGQGGVHHIHERYHSHWGTLFAARGYGVHDVLRPRFWADERVQPWHRANAFLYVKQGHPMAATLAAAGAPALAELAFMDCVHPWLYERSRVGGIALRDHLRALLPSLKRALQRRL
jgi:SAM-dependent methyltransferase